jgi:hypothetical protein
VNDQTHKKRGEAIQMSAFICALSIVKEEMRTGCDVKAHNIGVHSQGVMGLPLAPALPSLDQHPASSTKSDCTCQDICASISKAHPLLPSLPCSLLSLPRSDASAPCHGAHPPPSSSTPPVPLAARPPPHHCCPGPLQSLCYVCVCVCVCVVCERGGRKRVI